VEGKWTVKGRLERTDTVSPLANTLGRKLRTELSSRRRDVTSNNWRNKRQLIACIFNKVNIGKTVPYLRRLVTGFPRRWPGFEPWLGYVGFVVYKSAPRQVFS
jgi:hypothetical protein